MSIAFVQAASNTAAASSVTVTLGSATTAGNCVIACIALGNSSSTSAVSSVTLGGSAGNFSQIKAVGDLAVGAEQLAIWVDPNCAGGQTSVAITQTTGLVTMAWVFEFSGLALSALLDQSATFDSAVGTNSTFSITSGATTRASELAVGCAYAFSTTITGPSSPWVNEATLSQGNDRLQASYNILSSTGTVTYSGSFGAAQFNGQILVTLFTPPTGAGPAAQLTPPGRQSPMTLAGPVYFPPPAPPPVPFQQPAYQPPPQPPGRQSPARLARPVYFPPPEPPPKPPQQPAYLPPPQPPGLMSPAALAQPPRPSQGVVTVSPAGSVQPWPTVPVPRRRLVRAVAAGSKPFLGYVAVPAPLQGPYLPPRRRPARAVVEFTPVVTTNQPVGSVQPLMTVPIRRRQLQRAVVAHVYGAAYVKVPAPLQGPYLPPRRRPARAVAAGSKPFLGYVAVPAPLQGPYLPPRRVPARAVWRGSAPFLGFVAVPAPRQSPYLPPRRIPGRAVVEFIPVTTANAAPAVPVPPRQQPGPAPRRIPARAVVEFTPVTTTNSTAAAPSGTVQPWPTVPIRRRVLQRAVIAHAYGAGFVAVPAPRQSPYLPPRRTQVRATVAHAYGSAFVAVPAPRQQPGPAPRRKPGRAVVQFRAVRTTNGTAAVTAVLRQGDYDHKSWIKKKWILRL